MLSILFLLNSASYAPDYKSDMKDVAAEVSPYLHRGDLVIVGNNEMKLVGGKEFIRIAGVVRPEDLSGNIVQSTQMAEAHIEFSGDGETYLTPKMGFLQRVFLTVSTVWPGDWF